MLQDVQLTVTPQDFADAQGQVKLHRVFEALADYTASLVIHPTAKELLHFCADGDFGGNYGEALAQHVLHCENCSAIVEPEDISWLERANLARVVECELLAQLPDVYCLLNAGGYKLAICVDDANDGYVATGVEGLGGYFLYGDTPREAAEAYIEFLEVYFHELFTTYNEVDQGFPYYDRYLVSEQGGLSWSDLLLTSLRLQLPSH